MPGNTAVQAIAPRGFLKPNAEIQISRASGKRRTPSGIGFACITDANDDMPAHIPIEKIGHRPEFLPPAMLSKDAMRKISIRIFVV